MTKRNRLAANGRRFMGNQTAANCQGRVGGDDVFLVCCCFAQVCLFSWGLGLVWAHGVYIPM